MAWQSSRSRWITPRASASSSTTSTRNPAISTAPNPACPPDPRWREDAGVRSREGCGGTGQSEAATRQTWSPVQAPPLFARTEPPCSSTSCFTMESPSPSPPCLRVVEASACRKRSKTKGRNSAAIPSPVSMILISTCELTRSSSACTRPPPGVNLMALESRFQRTC